jgi:hypothetical protein
MADIVFPGQGGTSLNSAALPASNDLVIYKGDYVDIYVTIKDNAGTAIVLTGSTPKAQLKSDYNDRAPKDFTCTLTGTTGQVRIYLPSSVTSTLIPGSYIWDFQVTFSGGDTRTYLAGDVTVYNEVTT